MSKLLLPVAATLAVLGFAVAPAAAAGKTMHHAMHHRMSCLDYAWDSQEMKDCQAKGDTVAKPTSAKTKKSKKTT
jgi:hypothetical protein